MGKYKLLDHLALPGGLRRLGASRLGQLCAEIRGELIECVSATGGHLASNLGVVELTVALHRVFSSPTDQIVWDVGHQCYTHKLLTSRRDKLPTLRQSGGISGFPRPCESEHDAFVAGHASTSLSVADGLARGKELTGEPGHVIAVIGDGAFTGGMAFEGLNNLARKKNGKVIVVLNDNKMSISKNVGGLTRYLSRLRTNASYYRFKDITRTALRAIPFMGAGIAGAAADSVSQLKNLVYHTGFFEELGYVYMGPVDGHDLTALCDALTRAKSAGKPVLLHVETIKGKGYTFAEDNPGAYHGVSRFNPDTGGDALPPEDSFSDVFGRHLTRIASGDERVCAVTAAMKYATGLYHFSRRYKKSGRFFDVGIAEGHAVTVCAGLAAKGLLPVFAVYSSFLQRGYDQLIHDCSINPQHVVLGVDRAGLVGEDGETHQGVFDCAFLSSIPGSRIYSPASYRELELCMNEAIFAAPGLCAVRYPRGSQPDLAEECREPSTASLHLDSGGRKLLLVTYGRISGEVSRARQRLAQAGEKVSLLKLTRVWPLDRQALDTALLYDSILFIEEGALAGGIGEHFVARMATEGYKGVCAIRAIENGFVPHGGVDRQMKLLGLDADSIVKLALDCLPGRITERKDS